jgi:predicted ATPase
MPDDSVLLKRVVLNNYKSIKSCSVHLGPLTFLVGPNGAGKSNFLDALDLVAESLRCGLDQALDFRGGAGQLLRRSPERATHFGVHLEWQLPNNTQGSYAFQIGALPPVGFRVQKEVCYVFSRGGKGLVHYLVEDGKLTESSLEAGPVASGDRLYLTAASSLPELRPLYDALARIGIYDLRPARMHFPPPLVPGEILTSDGSNLANVLVTLAKEDMPVYRRIVRLVKSAVPGLHNMRVWRAGGRARLEFRMKSDDGKSEWGFWPQNMSDGTLHLLGALAALLPPVSGGTSRATLVGIEEPGAVLHPRAIGVISDALKVASRTSQVLVATHHPDLLDDKAVTVDQVRTVDNHLGRTVIRMLGGAEQTMVSEHLSTVGELLRLNQLGTGRAARTRTRVEGTGSSGGPA